MVHACAQVPLVLHRPDALVWPSSSTRAQAFNPQFVDQYVGPSKFANVTIELANTGTGTLDWSLIFVDGEGHSVQPSYGLLSTTTGLIKEGQLVQVTLTTSTYGLVPGTYTTRLQLSTNGACMCTV